MDYSEELAKKTLLATLLFVATGASSAQAIPPINDGVDEAVEIFSLPFSDTVDTSEATDAGDPVCFSEGSPTVWYVFTPLADATIEADTFGSEYDTTLSVYTGTPGALDQIACNDDDGGTLQSRVRFDALAGVTYLFMIAAFGDGPGGIAQLSVDVASGPPPESLTIELRIDPVLRFLPRSGRAIVSGTLTCSEPAIAEVFGVLRQEVGRFVVEGFFDTFDDLQCDGETPWSVETEFTNGRLAGGPAKVDAFAEAFALEDFDFAFDDAQANVRLRGGR